MRSMVAAAGTAVALALATGQAGAQAAGAGKQCDVRPGHASVKSVQTYLAAAREASDSVKRQRILGDARRSALEAFSKYGQESNPAAWYYLGRYYAAVEDVAGADSAFDRAVQLAPQCEDVIATHRQAMWLPIINLALDSMREGNYQAATHILHEAYAIYPADNRAPYYLARIFGNNGQLDSASYYFQQVVALGTEDTTTAESYGVSLFNLGLVLSMAEQWDSSAAWYRRYRVEIDANDSQAIMGQALALTAAGRQEEALALYDSVLGRADQMSPTDLFQTGEALFRAQQFAKAAVAFERGLERNKYFRPALYNLANSYLAIYSDARDRADSARADSVRAARNRDRQAQADAGQRRRVAHDEQEQAARLMEAVCLRLVEVDPQNSESLNLLAASYTMQGKDSLTVAMLERREALKYDIVVDMAQPVEGGFAVAGRIVNRGSAELQVPAIPFEFVDGDGGVITTGTVDATVIGGGGSSPFRVTGTGEGIMAVRYRPGT